MTNTYLFYDIETSGLNKAFDQVLQFAAIRTDLNLKELERHEIFIKLNPDVVPSPAAVLIHKINSEQMQQGEKEYEAIKKIYTLLNTPGTISVGYNTLGFDDEFLRFSFYRNLFPPYTHQFASGCSRMDIYPMVAAYQLFKPELINWPKIDNKISLKLENISKANNLMQGTAHNAMSDVEATVELARILQKEKSMWDYLCGAFNKKIDQERLQKLTFANNKYQQGLLIDGSFGSDKFFQTPALGLGWHSHYKNQSLWLPLDSFVLSETKLKEIATSTYVIKKRFGEPPILLPLNDHFGRYLNEDRLKIVQHNLEWIEKNQTFFFEIINYHKEYTYPDVINVDIDAALYQVGFMNDQNLYQCNEFHRADPYEKTALIDEFSSPNLKNQAIRILGRNYPESLKTNKKAYQDFINYLDLIKNNEDIFDYRNNTRLTPQKALIEIESLTQNINESQLKMLRDIYRNL